MQTKLQLLLKSGAIMISFPILFGIFCANRIHDPFEFLIFLAGAAVVVMLKSGIDEVAMAIYNQFGETTAIAIGFTVLGGLVLQWVVMLTLPLLTRNSLTRNYSVVFCLQAVFSFGNALTGLLVVKNWIDF